MCLSVEEWLCLWQFLLCLWMEEKKISTNSCDRVRFIKDTQGPDNNNINIDDSLSPPLKNRKCESMLLPVSFQLIFVHQIPFTCPLNTILLLSKTYDLHSYIRTHLGHFPLISNLALSSHIMWHHLNVCAVLCFESLFTRTQ